MMRSAKHAGTSRSSALLKTASLLTLLFAIATVAVPVAAWAQVDGGTEEVVESDAGPNAGHPYRDAGVVADTAPRAEPPPATSSGEGETALQRLSSTAMDILVPVFAAFILGLATMLLNWIRKKFKLQVTDAQIASWAGLARKASLRGAEWARKQVKDLVPDKKIPGPEVLEVATNWAIEMGKAAGLPEMARGKLVGLIEAELFDLRRQQETENLNGKDSGAPPSTV